MSGTATHGSPGRPAVTTTLTPRQLGIRRALGQTWDYALYDAGSVFVDRLPVEAIDGPAELNAMLRRVLRRLEAAR